MKSKKTKFWLKRALVGSAFSLGLMGAFVLQDDAVEERIAAYSSSLVSWAVGSKNSVTGDFPKVSDSYTESSIGRVANLAAKSVDSGPDKKEPNELHEIALKKIAPRTYREIPPCPKGPSG